MGRENFISMRQINFILWTGALATTWHDTTHIPVGHQWIPFAGMIVSLFWPGKPKAKEVQALAKPVAE
jgi:hypothetical protein